MKFCVWLALTTVITAFVWVAIARTQKWSEKTYRDGVLEGLVTFWDDNGQKFEEATYLNGTNTSVTRWDESGNQITR